MRDLRLSRKVVYGQIIFFQSRRFSGMTRPKLLEIYSIDFSIGTNTYMGIQTNRLTKPSSGRAKGARR